MVLRSYCDGVPLKFQFTRTDYLSLVLTPPRIRWTVPLNGNFLAQGRHKTLKLVWLELLDHQDNHVVKTFLQCMDETGT